MNDALLLTNAVAVLKQFSQLQIVRPRHTQHLRCLTLTQTHLVWDQGLATVEIAQGKSIADACIAVGATQIIWSSLPNDKIAGAKHFDSKAKVEDYT